MKIWNTWNTFCLSLITWEPAIGTWAQEMNWGSWNDLGAQWTVSLPWKLAFNLWVQTSVSNDDDDDDDDDVCSMITSGSATCHNVCLTRSHHRWHVSFATVTRSMDIQVLYLFTIFQHFHASLEALELSYFIFEAWKFLKNSMQSWKSMKFIRGVLENSYFCSCRLD